MKTLLIASTIFAALTAHVAIADETLPAPEYKQFYLHNNREVPADVALISALGGKEVFRCQTVSANLSKNKTSIALRNVKRPRATK